MFKEIFNILLFFGVLHSSTSLECYTCNFPGNENCTIPLDGDVPHGTCKDESLPPEWSRREDNTFLRAIERAMKVDSFKCVTITGYGQINSDAVEKGIIRSCAPSSLTCDKIKEQLQEVDVVNITCSFCNTNLCNGSSFLQISNLTIIFIVLLISLHYFK
ncbi:uncharacterized protein LOC113386800 [Ctenocephalides felis]|uniref:uncharacterized protein LOC113386800 n=1 Tax=Ctenocephalides felis TaxID=7515 RepID=UPI000E6E4C18|nr:uncharacterized protein LOC113386800 [Ctenocephalides felis]